MTDIRDSNCWSEQYQLPLCPNHNNPHIYCAYVNRIEPVETTVYEGFFARCVSNIILGGDGIFYRWPDRKEGAASWDEIIGAASISDHAAYWLLYHFRFKWHRFIFLKGYLRACSFGQSSMSWWSRFLVETWIRLAVKGNLEPGDAGGRLRTWLIISKTGILKDYWASKMTGAGYTLKNSLAIEPRENPWLTENAPDSWF